MSNRKDKQKRKERSDRRKERSALGVSPRRPDLPRTVREAARQEKTQEVKEVRDLMSIFRSPPLTNYVQRVTDKVVDYRDDGTTASAGGFTPSKVTKTPKRTERPEKNSTFKNQEHDVRNSPKARDVSKGCKKRPEGYHAKRAGGGASKKYVPWCK